MSDEQAVPEGVTSDGLYLDREEMVWKREGQMFRCIQSPGEGYDLRDPFEVGELDQWSPYLPLVAFTDEERAAVHDIAGQLATSLHLSAVARDRWGTSQPDLTRDLIAVDLWRAITEKTRAS